jgi:hypothetical protein
MAFGKVVPLGIGTSHKFGVAPSDLQVKWDHKLNCTWLSLLVARWWDTCKSPKAQPARLFPWEKLPFPTHRPSIK